MEKTNRYGYIIGMAALLLALPCAASETPAAAQAQEAAQLAAQPQEQTSARPAAGVTVSRTTLKRNADLMSVGLALDMRGLELPGNRAAVFTPVLVNGRDSMELPAVGVYSRTRWFQYLRAGEPIGGAAETSLRYSERPDELAYHADVAYAPWMDGSDLVLRRRDYGCCRTLLDGAALPVGRYEEVVYTPEFRYVAPVAAAEKRRELSGRAYIDFPVNRTEMYPEYRRNPIELQKIIGTIDSIRNDGDITVSSITIKGYASPEGPYSNNIRLAKGRTATLQRYVENMYRFEQGFIKTDYEPEDWGGLRDYVEGSGLEHREEILALIDSDMEPDAKNTKLRDAYPEEYRFLLQTVYPGLRHSDYTIEYTIRSYTDLAEIERLLHTQPQKLSLDEMYRLAQTCEPGSDLYNEVFEVAVRMYPEDATANLNAANAAMARRDFKSAERYLAKAGDSAEAAYARGVLKGLQGDFEGARTQVLEALKLGMPDTERILEHLGEAQECSRLQGAAAAEPAGAE